MFRLSRCEHACKSDPANTSPALMRRRVMNTLCVILSYLPHTQHIWHDLGWVHTCKVTAYRNTLSWQCKLESWPRNVSNVGYAVTLRVCSVRCRCLAIASKGWYGYGRSRCGRAAWRWTSTPAPVLTVSSLWCDGQIPTAHRKSR
jgi:hypothetical protein